MAMVVVLGIRLPATAQVTDKDVRQAIERGVEFLKENQDKTRGGWREIEVYPGGLSALCTLALLECGLEPDDPAVAQALDYLRGFGKPDTVYSVSLRTMVLCAAEPKKDLLTIRQNAAWLEQMQLTDATSVRDSRKGAWNYSQRLGDGDNSNTQFAMLALNEAERVGVAVDPRVWRLAQEYWLSTQRSDGSWGYKPSGQNPSTGSMTCAGICSVVIAQGRLSSGTASIQDGVVRCCGDSNETGAVERGLTWLAKNFSVRVNPGDDNWLLYYLYGLERVGRMTGRRFIGAHDWYREGAELLVREQDISGSWRGVGSHESNPLIATSLSLLFLSKGRRPVVMSKVKYTDQREWDLHEGGVPNLIRQIEKSWLRELTWQTIDLKAASVADLLESPILFFSGRQALDLSPEQSEVLRMYVEQGGFIFAEACDQNGCDGKAFDESFRQLMKELFPTSAFRQLPADHPVWYADGKVDPQYMQHLYGIDACCRTSVVYCPTNLSCFWELSAEGHELEAPADVQADIRARMQMGQNVVAYATNRVLKEKLDRPNVLMEENAVSDSSRGVLVIPVLRHGGGSEDAPNALTNLLRYVRQEVELRAMVEQREVSATSENLCEYPVLFTHGRRAFRWNAAERKALADFIANGGFLFADAICASPEFATSFRAEMEALFPGQKLERIPVNHPLFTNEFSGFDLSRVTVNDPLLSQEGERLDARHLQTSPVLEGIQVEGRYVVVFSPYDLSCGLESSTSLECKGYLKADAARIATNIILYAMGQ
jgi:hypothetical protein